MPGLDPGIQKGGAAMPEGFAITYWIAGSSPAMTKELIRG
jgi:hypothetical protein